MVCHARYLSPDNDKAHTGIWGRSITAAFIGNGSCDYKYRVKGRLTVDSTVFQLACTGHAYTGTIFFFSAGGVVVGRIGFPISISSRINATHTNQQRQRNGGANGSELLWFFNRMKYLSLD